MEYPHWKQIEKLQIPCTSDHALGELRMNKLKILNEKIPLFPLINKFEGKLANVLCLKTGECMGVCLDNLLVCN
jgi:hypothetical protein